MLIPGNTWQIVWQQAKPVPARRQKRLFDDTKEAEKVLHYLESRTIGQICQLTIASLFHAAIIKLDNEANTDASLIPNYHENMKKLMNTCCKLSRENWVTKDPGAIRCKKKNNILNLWLQRVIKTFLFHSVLFEQMGSVINGYCKCRTVYKSAKKFEKKIF